MTLEDHVGDVLRKARMGLNAPLEEAARLAGLSESEYSALEGSGKSSRVPDFEKLGHFLSLNGKKLANLANGWLPKPVDLGIWRELRQISTAEGGNTVHCYLVWDEVTREGALFDTGWTPEPVFKVIAENQLQLRHLFITHTHHDHVAGLAAIRERFPKLFLHTDAKGAPPQHKNRRNDCIQLGGLRITNRDTPGHAEDGVTYIVGNWSEDAPHVAIVGDAIFAGSMGGAPAHFALARQKVRDQIFSLPSETLICPGHGPVTSVEQERENNPFV
jgi:glyoxylase-like metal-dependent hydrolase (beta-lactamase superfamily II)